MNINYIKQELYKLTKKAIKHNEVPVAAIITHNNKIIAKAYNKVNNKNNILNHAEIMVINKASKKLKNWRLSDCDIYVTLEPCSMCREIIKKSRIKSTTYFIKQNNNKTENDPIYNFIDDSHLKEELKLFFYNKR